MIIGHSVFRYFYYFLPKVYRPFRNRNYSKIQIFSYVCHCGLRVCSRFDASAGYAKNAYFGELHLHTAYSLDAYIFGTTLNDPFSAYRFAKGAEIDMPAGGTKRLRTPIDFAAVTDHAEALGEFELCTSPGGVSYNTETCIGVRGGDMKPFQDIFAGISVSPAKRLEDICGADGTACTDAIPGPWSRIQQAANEANDPGNFTAFVAYEFSSNAPEGEAV